MLKKTLLKLMLAVLSLTASPGHAQNYPNRSDYLWVTVPDHRDWLYQTGEKATVDIQFYLYGMPVDTEITWSLSDDLQAADKTGTLKLKNGRATLNIGTRKTPGFRDLSLVATINGKKSKHHVKVGFSPEQIKPYTQEPADFWEFWQKQVASLKSTPLSYTRERAEEYCTDKIDCDLLKLNVDGQHSVYAYLSYPKNAKAGSCPISICPPGAGIKTIKEPLRHKYYAENGFLRLEMEIHGIDPRLPESTFREIQSAFAAKGNNYLENGLDNRDNYYMRHVYLALVRAVEMMTSLPEWDGKNVTFQGGSQGGALALIGAALCPNTTLTVANHPALSDMAAYAEKGRTGGYPHFNRVNAMLTPEKIKGMAYYDVVNFARHIACPVFMTWGYNDNVCPPTTSYAVWNTLKGEKESLITPVNEHWTSETTEYGHMVWVKNRLK